ncbi:MAG TPA: DUF2142 domain-containing protein [Stellaceae bacterium]|nr:DUF2142 domain-containing protein [Stellaceae bacterium]
MSEQSEQLRQGLARPTCRKSLIPTKEDGLVSRAVQLKPALVYLLVGLVGIISMVVLTPPFQVPDEPGHFYRAYQLSELQLRGSVRNGKAGGMLPSSLSELFKNFLSGDITWYTWQPVVARPLRQTMLSLNRPLEPNTREFIDFTNVAFYSPMAYLPQAIAIAGGRWMGAGPLALLYLARLANALVAVALLTWAVRLMPIGREAVMLAALLPMVVFECASVSPDAGVIGTAFLFTAVALRAQLRDGWTSGEVVVAAISGLVFCSEKPVYAPLLVLGFPAVLTGVRIKQKLIVQLVILVVALGATVFWIFFSLSKTVTLLSGMNPTNQLVYIYKHPFVYCKIFVYSLIHYSVFYYKSLVGILGWMRVPLPKFAYILPLGALLLGFLAQHRDGARLPAYAVAWNALLLTGSIFLIMTSQYLIFTHVGSQAILGAQGRYFIPLLPLFIATACSVARLRLSPKASSLAFLGMTAIVGVEILIADIAIVRAYQVF